MGKLKKKPLNKSTKRYKKVLKPLKHIIFEHFYILKSISYFHHQAFQFLGKLLANKKPPKSMVYLKQPF